MTTGVPSSSVPAPSLPMMMGNEIPSRCDVIPRSVNRSWRLRVACDTFTRVHPSSTWGSGCSPMRNAGSGSSASAWVARTENITISLPKEASPPYSRQLISDSRHSAAVDDNFGSGDGAGTGRDEEGNEVRHFLWLCRAAKGNAAERLHDNLLATFEIGAGLLPEPLRERHSGFGLHPARRDAHHAGAFRRNLFRQAFAVRSERRLRGGIGRRRSRQRKLVLDRGDMNNDTGSLLDHRRQERPVDANSGHQILIQLLRPLIVVDDGESTRRCARSAHDIDDDVDPAELFRNRGCQGGAAVCRRKVRRDEMHTFRQCLGRGTGGRYYLDADVTQYGHDGGPNALCATRDKRTTVSELEVEAHGMISSDAILSPSSPKKNRRSTGLPGKLPVRWLVMTVFPSSCTDAKGSLVYVYLPSAFHFLMAG